MNPVMNETLSVIDEHITDLNSPNRRDSAFDRLQATLGRAEETRDEPLQRRSYINGQETDEEESHLLTTAEVSSWSSARVAEYLEDAGVDKVHCEVFRDQEITGEVLLGMEQSAIFIKEFDLGSVGRRLKTWSKIKALQEEISTPLRTPSMARSGSDYSTYHAEKTAEQSGPMATSALATMSPTHHLFPQDAMHMHKQRQGSQARAQDRRSGSAPLASITSFSHSTDDSAYRPDYASRPSAASIRQMNHARRHSSMDSSATFAEQQHTESTNRHSRKISLDRLWTMGGMESSTNTKRLSKISQGQGHIHSLSGGSIKMPSETFVGTTQSHDRNPSEDSSPRYESGLEVSKRSSRHRFLPKRLANSVPHSRNPSDNATPDLANSTLSATPVDSPLEPVSSQSDASKSSGARSSSHPAIVSVQSNNTNVDSPPMVTRLEYSPRPDRDTSRISQSPSAPAQVKPFLSRPRAQGLRIGADTAASNDKPKPMAPVESPARTGSTTPSTGTKSFEIAKSDNRESTGSSQQSTPVSFDAPQAPPKTRPRARSKKFTSAYTRGLEQKPPVEQIAGCDYSGWMKKRSANIMGSWKPRLFVLRGRRLSYYYAENDTEEKGLIDISGHRVLPAENEKITGLHAQIAGALSPSTTEQSPKLATASAMDLAACPADDEEKDDCLFIFKLVPPREGMSKAVNFTRPAVHYFAVNSRREGRLWMAALMKATIDHNSSGVVTTTYNQETISLAKARARNELPPTLRNAQIKSGEANRVLDNSARKDSAGPNGLGIDGIGSSAAHSTDPRQSPAVSSRSTGSADSNITELRTFSFQSIDESLRDAAAVA